VRRSPPQNSSNIFSPKSFFDDQERQILLRLRVEPVVAASVMSHAGAPTAVMARHGSDHSDENRDRSPIARRRRQGPLFPRAHHSKKRVHEASGNALGLMTNLWAQRSQIILANRMQPLLFATVIRIFIPAGASSRASESRDGPGSRRPGHFHSSGFTCHADRPLLDLFDAEGQADLTSRIQALERVTDHRRPSMKGILIIRCQLGWQRYL